MAGRVELSPMAAGDEEEPSLHDRLSTTVPMFVPDTYNLCEGMATGITSGLGVHNINSGDPHVPIVQLSRALIGGSVLTVGMVIATALYKPASGVVFGTHRVIYYLILAILFIWGVAGILTGIWMSLSHQISNRRLSFAKIVLALGLIPFCAILGITGFAFTQTKMI